MQYFIAKEVTVKQAIKAEKSKSFSSYFTLSKKEFKKDSQNVLDRLGEVLADIKCRNPSAIRQRIESTHLKWNGGGFRSEYKTTT